MRILFTRFPLESAKRGGAENQTISLIQGLIKRGHEVSFLGSCTALLEALQEIDVPVVPLDIGEPPVSKKHVLTFFFRKKRMRSKMKNYLKSLQEKPDVICMLSLSEKILLTPWALKKGMRVVWIEHDPVGSWLTLNPWRLQLMRLSKRVQTITVSDFSKRRYVSLGFPVQNIKAIPNGVPEPKQTFTPSSALNTKNTFYIGCIARLAEEKGVDVLMRSVADLPNVHLHILGKGPEERELHDLAQSLQLHRRVKMTDWIDDIEEFFASIHMLALPSRTIDPFGLAAAEAMIRGIPVIVTDRCGISDYLTHKKDAFIVPAGNTSELRHAIWALSDPHIRANMGREGKKTAESAFSLERMIERYEEILIGIH